MGGEEGCPNKKEWGPTKNSKINQRGGLLFGTEEYEICSKLMIKTIIIITQ